MKKIALICLALALALAAVPALAEEDTLDTKATIQFDETGALELLDSETNSEFGVTFGNMNIPFGMQSIPLYQQSYEAIQRGEFTRYGVIVADARGAQDAGWDLKVKIPGAFTHESSDAAASFNAMITLANGTASSTQTNNGTLASNAIEVQSTGTDVMVMSADGIGIGAFYADWAMGDISLGLGTDFGNIRAGQYEATMVWTLTPIVEAEPEA